MEIGERSLCETSVSNANAVPVTDPGFAGPVDVGAPDDEVGLGGGASAVAHVVRY